MGDLARDPVAFDLFQAILDRSYTTLLGPDGKRFVDDYFTTLRATAPGSSLDDLARAVVPMRERFGRLGLDAVYQDRFRGENMDTSLRLAGIDAFADPVVDVGAGDNLLGRRLLDMAPHIQRVTGVDTHSGAQVDPPRLRFTRQTTPRELPIASTTQASAVCRYSLHHMTPREQQAIAQEVHRVLRPGGAWIVYENAYSPSIAPLGGDPDGLHERLLALGDTRRIDLLLACLDSFSLGIKDKDMQFANTFRSVEEWDAFFAAHRFRVDRRLYLGLPTYDLHQAPLAIFVLSKAG